MPKTNFTYTKSIGATQGGWQPTGIKVEQGDTIEFANATGTMQPWAGATAYGPNGDSSITWDLSLLPTEKFCKLVGNIINHDAASQAFGIGTGISKVANISGEIFLGINDGVNWGDNVGPGFTVEITLPQELFLLIPPSQPLGVNPADQFALVRDYGTHQIEQPDQLGVDYTVNPDTPYFDSGSYSDPLTRMATKLRSRRVTSMTPGIITSVFREETTVGENNDPRQPGETEGITTEVLTWYPYQDGIPDAYYLIQYTHMFPTFGAWQSLTFPSIEEQITNNTVLSVRANQYTQLPLNTRENRVALGPIISSGTELGTYAMIGLASVGPHLHISMARFSQVGQLPSVASGRPQSLPQPFIDWLANPFDTTQFDPELYVPGALNG
jgi:hypothetical protein